MFQKIGNLFRSIQGWAFLIGIGGPVVLNFLTGIFEHQPWTFRIPAIMATLAASMGFVYLSLVVWEMGTSFLPSRKEQNRIAEEIKGLEQDGVTELDTHSISALWAGTNEIGNVTRHLRFRRIKSAINNGEIKNPMFRDQRPGALNNEANIYTWVSLDALKEFFAKNGIIRKDD